VRTVHFLKCWPNEYEAVKQGIKRADFRLNDRDYNAGDLLLLQKYWPTLQEWADAHLDEPYGDGEWNPDDAGEFAFKDQLLMVLHVQHGGHFGIPEGYVVLSLAPPVPWSVFTRPETVLAR